MSIEQSATPVEAPRIQWRVKVADKVYGPYPRSRMLEFLDEGRVTAETEIACGHDEHFFRADEHPNLRWNFGQAPVDGAAAEEDSAPTVCNYLIAGKMLANHNEFESLLNKSGRFARAGVGIWILRSRVTLPQLRNRLSSVLGKDEQFVIVNASRGRLAWFNLGAEPDAAIRGVWDCELETD